jgi:transcriptional regulator with XRE-family HTH domain
MPGNVSPEVRRRRLAAELRRLRDRSGQTGDEVASQLGWSPSKVSRYELARTGLRPSDVRKMLEVYGVESARQEELLALARQAATAKGWWEEYADIMSDEYTSIIGLEDEASSELSWYLEVIPHLLQTEAYAREINSKGYSLGPVPPAQIERSVQARMKRQELLRRDPPLELVTVLDESVIRRRLASPPVMLDQLRHLMAVAELPNVTLRILRLSADFPIIMSSFDLLRFSHEGEAAETTLPDVVYTEHLRSTLFFDGEADTYQYRLVFDRLLGSSLSPQDSLSLISRTIDTDWA